MEGTVYGTALAVLRSAFAEQYVLYTNIGITIGLAACVAVSVLLLLIKLLGGMVMAIARTIQQRLLSYEEVRILHAKHMKSCIKHAVGCGTISKEQGDLMMAEMAKRFSRWEFLPRKKVVIPNAAVVKAAIRARLPKDKLPDLTKVQPGPAPTSLQGLFSKLQLSPAK